MSETFFDRPELYRSLLESLPIGIYILDREHRVRFWNRRAEQLTGHLAHEAMGQDGIGHLLEPCDRDGRAVKGGNCSVTAALTRGHEQQFTAFYLHKDGHRVAVRGRARAIFEANDAIAGAVVLFKEAFASGEESSGTAMYGCMDPSTGIPTCRLTRAVLAECLVGLEPSQQGFAVLRIRVLGLDEFRSKHGIQSAVPFLRTTAHTLRHSLDPANFLGRWGEDDSLPYCRRRVRSQRPALRKRSGAWSPISRFRGGVTVSRWRRWFPTSWPGRATSWSSC